eukprot:5662484-Prymnesium_polylepis.1
MLCRSRSRDGRAAAAAAEAPTVPYWQLLVFQFLFSVPYAFGAIAKLNEDWCLRAQPLKVCARATDGAPTACTRCRGTPERRNVHPSARRLARQVWLRPNSHKVERFPRFVREA